MSVGTERLTIRLARRVCLLGVVAAACLSHCGAVNAREGRSDFAVVPTQSDFGGVGVFQTPTARMRPDGFFSVGYSHIHPFNRIRFALQFFPWLETVFRYTAITTGSYGPIDPGQSYKDRSLDFKFRVWNESRYAPEVSVGFRDLIGTGVFASEYLVASKRYNNFDFSLGLGWGAFAASNALDNPVASLFSGFTDRDRQVDQGGKFAIDSIFRGERIGVFGSITYELESLPMALHMEYDASNQLAIAAQIAPPPGQEPLRPGTDPFPLNVGMSYRLSSDIDLRVGLERGRALMEEVWESTEVIYDMDAQVTPENGWRMVEVDYPVLATRSNPKYRQHVGGPDGFILWQLYLSLGAKLEVSRQSYFESAVLLDIYNTFDEISIASDSQLPRVRSDIKEYLQQGPSHIARLDFTHQLKFKPHWYGRFSVGIFEEMYGGVGAEVLYYPLDGDLAIGADMNWVKQRAFNGLLGFRDYSVATGHVSMYYDMPFYDMRVIVHAGRYLAGDYGATLDVSREFGSGFRFGGFATLTDVPFDVFGEGSFDKGIYVSFPFDLLSFDRPRGSASFAFRPLTRDGGQMVVGGKRLYGLVRNGHAQDLYAGWRHLLD